MKCLVVSDTHTNLEFYKGCLSRYLPSSIDLVIHLGDNYIDALLAHEYNHKLVCVPGTRCSQYEDTLIENRRFELFNSWRCLLSHTPTISMGDLSTDVNPLEEIKNNKCDVFLHGHTHKQTVRRISNVIILNPGHLKSNFDRGEKPGYMIVNFGLKTLQVSCYDCISHSCNATHEFTK